jgi:hypothetical protein
VHAKPSDYFVRIDGGKYDREHYYQSPQSYTSLFCDKVKRFGLKYAPLFANSFFFSQKVAPYLTLFLNGTGWAPSFPRLMTSEQLQTTLTRAKTYGGSRFTNIGDISCDVGVCPLSSFKTKPWPNPDSTHRAASNSSPAQRPSPTRPSTSNSPDIPKRSLLCV